MLTEQFKSFDLVRSSNLYPEFTFFYARNSLFDLGRELVCRCKLDKAFFGYLCYLCTVRKSNSCKLG